MKNSLNEKKERDVLPDDLLQDIARLKGVSVSQQAVSIAASILYPVSAAIAAEKEEAARRKGEPLRKALEEAAPGQEIRGYGIFIGTWQPEGLSQKFNVFAAPEDLVDRRGKPRSYADTVGTLSKLKDWHGYAGADYENDTALYAALENGSYDGKWVIPPLEVLSGRDANGNLVQQDHIRRYQDAGALKNTFSRGSSNFYWSSTEDHDDPSHVRNVCLSDGRVDLNHKNGLSVCCRPIRLEPAL
jgi:hypothetical protein